MFKRWSAVLGGLGTVALAALSCAMCPMCLPLYAGALSLIGIDVSFRPLMFVLAAVSLALMAWQIRAHHASKLPFVTALLGAISMPFAQGSFIYVSLFVFMGSLLWSKLTLKHKGKDCC